MGVTCVSVNPETLRRGKVYNPIQRPRTVIRNTTSNLSRSSLNTSKEVASQPRFTSFMDELDYNRAHVADNPDAYVRSVRTLLAALG